MWADIRSLQCWNCLNTIHCESHSFCTSNCNRRHSHKESITRTNAHHYSDVQIICDWKDILFMILTHTRFKETKLNVTEATKSNAKLSMHSMMKYLPWLCWTSAWSPPASRSWAEAHNIPADAVSSSGPSLNWSCPFFACFLFKTGHLTLIKCPPDSHRSSRLVSFLYTLLWEGET